jgi:hypothetical protein
MPPSVAGQVVVVQVYAYYLADQVAGLDVARGQAGRAGTVAGDDEISLILLAPLGEKAAPGLAQAQEHRGVAEQSCYQNEHE